MGSDPFQRLSSRGNAITIEKNGHRSVIRGNPLDVLGSYLDKYRIEDMSGIMPCCGAFGYFAYDIGRIIEKLPEKAVDDLHLPECWFGFYDLVIIHDNLKEKTYAISTGFPETDENKRNRRANERLSDLKIRLESMADSAEFLLHQAPKPRSYLNNTISRNNRVNGLKGNFTRRGYLKAVAKAREYIIAGEIYEVNLSQRFEADLTASPYNLFIVLRGINPAPFAAYIDCGEVTIVSASPERFLRCRGDMVETRPIKGTRRRGTTPEEDRMNAEALSNSVKDHAENMMIVDLERNDLGRVCRYGSIKVSQFAALEKFPTVFHLTSTITGQLRKDKDRIDLLKATLPGGSITGAPKIRSMEIIDELEPTRRSIYTGSLGYLGFDGSMDLNIVIRTFLIKGNKAYFQVGGAVVYDSDPESEYVETLDKGKALIEALNRFGP
jgi:para-aminobenzoate synthetase component 1